jgi:hypothetical protein
MVPMALINGRIVSGCMSPSGHFEAGCHCQDMQDANGSGQKKAISTSQCHCPCCQGSTCCCCKGKGNCCNSVAKTAGPTHGNGIQSGDHCRPFSMYTLTPAVNTSAPTGDVHQLAELSLVFVDLPFFATSATVAHGIELDTGPPPDNLVVALHRFLI